jgi:hypothetical protein
VTWEVGKGSVIRIPGALSDWPDLLDRGGYPRRYNLALEF